MLDQEHHQVSGIPSHPSKVHIPSGPSRPAIRKVLHEVLLTDSAMSAFCLDYFPAAYKCFSSTMDRISKVNLLIEMSSVTAIWEALQLHLRDEPQRLVTLSQMLKYVDSPATLQSQRAIDAMERLYLERARLLENQKSVFEIDNHILALKRSLRQGPQLNEGEVLADRYRLLEVLGKGGFAKVWQAFDRKARKLIAVKVLHSDQVEDRNRRERFLRGARQMRSLEHPHIVRMLDGPDEYMGFCYFAMEHLAGSDLARAIVNGQLDTNDGLLAILQIGSALEFAHQRGVIHRDVKPQNILLVGNGLAKLCDFDLVWASDTTGGTRTGAMGTFTYAAPEELDDASRIDVRADVYSLGMTALFVLHKHSLPRAAVFSRPQFIDKLACPATLKNVLRQATAVDPQERYATVAEFCEALRDTIVTNTIFSAVPKLPTKTEGKQPDSFECEPDSVAAMPSVAMPSPALIIEQSESNEVAGPIPRSSYMWWLAASTGLLLLTIEAVFAIYWFSLAEAPHHTNTEVNIPEGTGLSSKQSNVEISFEAKPSRVNAPIKPVDLTKATQTKNLLALRKAGAPFPPLRLGDPLPRVEVDTLYPKHRSPEVVPDIIDAPPDLAPTQQPDSSPATEQNPYKFDLSTAKSISPRVQLAESCYHEQDFACTVRELRIVLKIERKPCLLLSIAHATFAMGRILEARAFFEEALELESDLSLSPRKPAGSDGMP